MININHIKGNNRESLNEFFHGTTPVPPNYLEELKLVGGGELLILYIDKLVHTLEVVRSTIEIEDFTMDESTLGKLLEGSKDAGDLRITNCKINITGLLTLDDRISYKTTSLTIGNLKDSKDLSLLAQSLGGTKMTDTLTSVNVS